MIVNNKCKYESDSWCEKMRSYVLFKIKALCTHNAFLPEYTIHTNE